MIYREEKGDLFEMSGYSFAHCISQDCAMGAGIAVAFDKKFKGMKRYCLRVIEENNLSFPCVVPFTDSYKNYDIFVFNLVTKRVCYGKPTYTTITKAIEDMAFMCKQFNVKKLAMPKIGCGLDRLQWGKVREIIKEAFKDTDIEIVVKHL